MLVFLYINILFFLAYGKGIEEVQERNVLSREKYGKGDDFKYRYKKENRIEESLRKNPGFPGYISRTVSWNRYAS